MNKPRILLVPDVKNWGGWVRAEYIKKYLSDEYQFDIMDADEFNEWELSSNTNYFNMDDVKEFSNRSVDKRVFEFNEFKRYTVDQRKKRSYDMYYFMFHTMLMKKSIKRFLNTDAKIVTIVTGFPTLKQIFYGRNGNREKAKKKFLHLANKCQAIFANNYISLNDLQEIYDPKKTFYMPRGVDPEVFHPKTDRFKRKENITVAYVGKPVPEKGLREFIQPACEQASVKLIFNDRNYENALSPEEMNVFYNKADVYVVASTIDGTPNPALEAASCGKPIIANRIGNMPEFIQDGVNGFLFDEPNINKYANKLMWFKTNQKRMFEMGQAARSTVTSWWTWRSVVNKHERKAFRRILNG